RELSYTRLRTTPEVSNGIPVAPIPLAPEGREVAHLITSRPDVPRFGDELDLADHRILLNEVEEGRKTVHVVELPSKRRCQIESESIDVHVEDPVAERVHDQLQRVGMTHADRVAPPALLVQLAGLAL